jgi:hypothetical protein
MVFQYPSQGHERRHEPRGYLDYRSFKPWLRDEFHFRCLYCLWRETWSADGDSAFSVDHVKPRVTHPHLNCDCSNLLYVCCRCNTLKQDVSLPLDPCEDGWAKHLQVGDNGVVQPLSKTGEELIEACRLNRATLVEARRTVLEILAMLRATDTANARSLLQRYLGFPDNLPMLSRLRPPGGNGRPNGIASSFYERRERGELPEALE